MHDQRGISNVELGWILWSIFIIGLGLFMIVLAL